MMSCSLNMNYGTLVFWGVGDFCGPISVAQPLLITITQEGFTLKKKKKIVRITATCFSNPHTNLGVSRSRRLGVNTAKLGSAIFFSDPCVFGYIF